MSVQLNTSAKEMPAAAQIQPAANAQAQNGASEKSHGIGSEIVPFKRNVLLEGCTLPNNLQALAVSYLTYSKLARFRNPLAGMDIMDMRKNVEDLVEFSSGADETEVTIDRVFAQVDPALYGFLGNIHGLFGRRMESVCTLIGPRDCPEQWEPNWFQKHQWQHFYGMESYAPTQAFYSPELTLRIGGEFCMVTAFGRSPKELQALLQDKNVHLLEARYCMNENEPSACDQVTLALPQIRFLSLACTAHTVDVSQCKSLKQLRVLALVNPDDGRTLEINVRGLKCEVSAACHAPFSSLPIKLLATDAQGGEVTQEAAGALHHKPQDQVDKKDGAKV